MLDWVEVELVPISEIIEAERRVKERCLKAIPTGVQYDPELWDAICKAIDSGLDIARTAISSLK